MTKRTKKQLEDEVIRVSIEAVNYRQIPIMKLREVSDVARKALVAGSTIPQAVEKTREFVKTIETK